MSGLTAWTGLEFIGILKLKNLGKPKEGETVVVSAAAGAAGEYAV